MAKPQLSSRVPRPTKEAVEQYAQEHELSQSDAARRLIERGLDYERGRLSSSEGDDTDATRRVAYLREQIRVLFWGFFLAVGVAFVLGLSAFIAPSLVGAAIALLQVAALAVLAIVALYSRIAQIRKHAGDGGYMTQLRRGIRRRVGSLPDDSADTEAT
jgi:VIT1/CCC1 family predicted Fe2+/Mn2+ transporter